MTLQRQMIVRIALPTLLIYMLVVGLTARYVYRESRAAVERDMGRLAFSYASRFDGHLREALRIAETTARAMEAAPDITDEALYNLLIRNVEQTDLVYGSCMAFEPGVRRPGAELFAPYVHRASGGLQRMNIDDSVYDWYHDPRFTWFSKPKSLGTGVWSEPYFDEGAGNVLMSTYSAPFEMHGSFGGVNTVDIDLPRLRETVGRQFEQDLDFVILDAEGRFVFDPDATRIMSKTIFDVAGETDNPPLAALARQMLAGAPGAGLIERWDAPRRQLVYHAPIRSPNWVFACRVPESVVLADVRRRTLWSAAALTLTLAMIIGCISLVARRIARPITQLSDKVLQVASGDLQARIAESAQADEIRHLAQSFNRMTSDLRAHIERLACETAARQRLHHDLEIARKIQRGLLPVMKPDLPGHDIAGWSQPADQTGGDYYDWQSLPDRRTIVTLADVSGHGIGPAVVTAACRAYSRASFATLREFAPVVAQLNDLLVADLPQGHFITFVAALLDPRSDHVEVISAGHGPVLHYVAAERRVVELESSNLPLGVAPGLTFHPALRRHLAPGDSLLLLTDGFCEWTNPQEEMFGVESLCAAVVQLAHLPSEQIITGLYEKVRAFSQGTPQADDVTAVVVKRTPGAAEIRAG
jgi:sigma-B regulation protein RsbU (phosphoserine phosphatase)